MIFSATAGLYLLRLNRSSSSSIPKSEIFCRVRSVICFSISPRPNSMSGIVVGKTVPLFSNSSSRTGFRPLGNTDDLYKVVRGNSGSRFASENVIQARQGTAFVVEPIIVEERIADTPSGKTIENNVELVFGRAFSRRSVPGEDTLVKTVHFIEHGQFDLQSGVCDRANDFAETRDDHSFILMDNEKQRSPFERCENEENPQNRHQSALQKAHNGRNSRGSWSDIDHVHWDALV